MSIAKHHRAFLHLGRTALFALVLSSCQSDDPTAPDPGPETGRILVDAEPSQINAPWFLVQPDQQIREGAGTSSLEDMEAGEYTLVWAPVPGWKSPTPNPLNQALAGGAEISFSATYTEIVVDTGNIAIDSNPDEIDAPWTLTGPSGFHHEGHGDQILANREPGVYTLTFQDVPNYETAGAVQGTLEAGSRLDLGGSYIYQAPPALGTIIVDITPDWISAPWTVTGPNGFSDQGNGDASITEVPVGSYTITFGDLSGWNLPQPSTYTRSVEAGGVQVCAGVYTEIGDPSPGTPSISGVSGSLSNGGQLTLGGSSFGAHDLQLSSGAGPDGWIEANPAGTDFDRLAGAPGWDVGMSSDSAPPVLTSERAYSGRQSALARIDGDGLSNWQSVMRYHRPETFKRIYVSFWIYWEPLNASPYRHTQWKMWRINDTGTVVDRTGQFLSTGRYNASSGEYYEYSAGFFCVLDCSSYAWDYCMENMRPEPYYPPADNQVANYRYLNRARSIPWSASMPSPGQWDRVELYLQRSDMDASNGVAEFWITKPNSARYKIDRLEGIRSLTSATDCRNVSGPWEYFQFQNYFDDDGSWDAPVFTSERANFFYDDIYLQFGTQARVELGDKSAYNACSKLAVQTPVRWDDQSIEIDLNHGPFSPGSTVYLFVVGENGEASTGYPVLLQ